jgi:hypothetical protein
MTMLTTDEGVLVETLRAAFQRAALLESQGVPCAEAWSRATREALKAMPAGVTRERAHELTLLVGLRYAGAQTIGRNAQGEAALAVLTGSPTTDAGLAHARVVA